MNIKVDLTIVLLLLILKFTLFPQLSFGIVLLPVIVGFLFNFTMGFINGWRDRNG
tara:strand:+ start:1430 stop:1594 length:165 start_codon:yes stop_codon:yes gene_type:complete